MLNQKKVISNQIGEVVKAPLPQNKSPKKSYVPAGGMAKFFKQNKTDAAAKPQNKNSVPMMLFKQRK
jgi:formylmethanofuran dehydrogenase subunit D